MKHAFLAVAVVLLAAGPPPAHSNPPPRSNPPAQHYQAPRSNPPPQQHSAPPQHFNLNGDLNYRRPVTPRNPNVTVVAPPPRPAYTQTRIPAGHVIVYPHYQPNHWWWNHGVVWTPAPAYWGGGFWGPFAFGLAVGLYGSYPYNGVDYYSYQVQPDTPGSQLLQNYGLTQTACGQPNLVVIWGPDNSVICAFPNNTVAPGQYTIDPATLTLVSATGP